MSSEAPLEERGSNHSHAINIRNGHRPVSAEKLQDACVGFFNPFPLMKVFICDQFNIVFFQSKSGNEKLKCHPDNKLFGQRSQSPNKLRKQLMN